MKIVEVNGVFEVLDEAQNVVVKTYKCEGDAKNYVAKMSSVSSVSSVKVNFPKSFSITKRFEFLSELTKMVIRNISPALIVTGEGGLGKSYSVMSELRQANLKEDEDYIIIKGFSTAKMLFRTLFENNGKLIIFDDCDSILTDKIALNILKAAVDSYDLRTVSWNAEFSLNESMPNSFDFVGRVVFISNISYDNFNQAIKSRCLNVDLQMDENDKIERMESILENILPEVPFNFKREALDFIAENKSLAQDLNMRTLEKVVKIRMSVSRDWKDLALYMLAR